MAHDSDLTDALGGFARDLPDAPPLDPSDANVELSDALDFTPPDSLDLDLYFRRMTDNPAIPAQIK